MKIAVLGTGMVGNAIGSAWIELGDITTARGTEMLLPLWVRTWAATGNGNFSFKVVR